MNDMMEDKRQNEKQLDKLSRETRQYQELALATKKQLSDKERELEQYRQDFLVKHDNAKLEQEEHAARTFTLKEKLHES
jgi:hypothetical protein